MNYNSKYVVRLTEEERTELEGLVKTGKVAARKRQGAHVLLKANADREDSGATDQQISQALDVGVATVHRVRQAYVEKGLDEALGRRPPGCIDDRRHRCYLLAASASGSTSSKNSFFAATSKRLSEVTKRRRPRF